MYKYLVASWSFFKEYVVNPIIVFMRFLYQAPWGFLLGLIIMPSQLRYRQHAVEHSGDNLYTNERGSDEPDVLIFYVPGNNASVSENSLIDALHDQLADQISMNIRLIGIDPPGVIHFEFIYCEDQIINRVKFNIQNF